MVCRMDNDWKKRLGMVYSTNPEYQFNSEQEEAIERLAPNQQTLYISLDRKNRKGKSVTLINGYVGTGEELKALARELKSKCGVGGSAREGEILIQGDFRDRIASLLKEKRFHVKHSGG